VHSTGRCTALMRTWFLESFDLASWTCPDGKFVVFRAREPYDVRAKVQIANLGKHSMSFWKKLFGAKEPPMGKSAKRRPPQPFGTVHSQPPSTRPITDMAKPRSTWPRRSRVNSSRGALMDYNMPLLSSCALGINQKENHGLRHFSHASRCF